MNIEHPVHIFEWSPKKETDRSHSHDHLELGYCLSGIGQFYFGEKTYDVRAGDLFIVNNLEKHAARSNPDDPSNYLFVFFHPLAIEQVDSELLLPFIYRPQSFQNLIPAEESISREVGMLIMEMWTEARDQNKGYKGMILSRLIQISALLLRYYGQHTAAEEWNRALSSYRRLRKVLEFINAHFRDPITLSDVADRLNLSPSRARHLFAEKLGEGFKEYLQHIRINEVKKLLASTDLPISEIIYECGFQSHAPFYRTFQNQVGTTPVQYRRQNSKIALFENFLTE